MMKRMQVFIAFVVMLNALVACSIGPDPHPNLGPTPTPPPPCQEDDVHASVSWDGGIVLTLNHCLIRDVKVQSVTVAFIAGLISAICPNILCKGVVTGIAAFVEAQVVLLGNADELCNGNGAILEIGSFKDKTLWTINNVCNLSPGHLTVTDNNPDGESNLRCYASNSSTPINLSFTVQNTGQESVKWHISIYSKDHYHPQNLKVYVGVDNHHIRSGLTPDLYDEWGTTPNHGTPLVIKGQVTPGEVKQHGHQLTISFIAGSGSDSQNPPPITMSCA